MKNTNIIVEKYIKTFHFDRTDQAKYDQFNYNIPRIFYTQIQLL